MTAFRRLICILALLIPAAGAAAPQVTVTIKPLHSLVAAVMDGVAAPRRLLPDGASPHAYALRPSEMRALSSADLVFWMGPALETFLVQPLAALPPSVRRVALMDAPGIQHLPARAGGLWSEAEHDHAHDHHDHGGRDLDPHVWLDPMNAVAMLRHIAAVLAEIDPAHGQRYTENAHAAEAALRALDARLRERLAPVRALPYVVFHDGYQYFEHRYGLHPVGALSVTPGVSPGARRVRQLRERILSSGARCVFAEPQFQPALAARLTEDTPAQAAVLDPLGMDVPEGPGAYAAILEGLAEALVGCLADGKG